MLTTSRIKKKTAFFSLYDTNFVTEFAKILIKKDWTVIATKETSSVLRKKNIKHLTLENYLNYKKKHNFPPTLHPKLEEALTQNYKKKIDLVYVVTYPTKIGKDIGGHTIISLATKGNRIVVTNTKDMKMITNIIKNNKTINSVINKNLKNKAWKQVSDFYLSLSQRYNKYNSKYLKLEYRNKALHGENPNQKPCKIYSIKSNAVSAINSNRYDINKLCYTNIVDLDNLINIAILLSKTFKKVFNKIPYISLAAKHGNPCGASFSWSSKEETITNSLNTNSDAMLGGEFLCNFDLNKKLAEKIYYNKKDKRKLDMVFSTKYHENALNVFKQRKQTKIISNYNLNNIKNNKELFYRKINAGFLEQPNQEFILSKKNFKGNKFNHEKIQDIILAWCIVSNSFFGGNEVALVKNKKLLMCSGGPSTLEATKTLFFRLKNIGKKEISKGALFAADAFFPFTDCLKILLKNNCFDGIVPTGSINDNKVYEFCRQNKMNVVFLDKNIRGFCRH